MALHTKYRPEVLGEMVGNEALVKSLLSLIDSEEKPHTYLFTGSRGCGKTTLARILANEMGCHSADIIELDIATNRGIDAARELKANLAYKPLHGKARAFILDEVHQGTKDFFNALLKSLEEPYEHLYFFLCTTDPQKVLKTVKSRCSTYEVEPLSQKEIAFMLGQIVKKERKRVPREVLSAIAKANEGIPRDSLVMLEQIINLDDQEEMFAVVKSIKETEEQVIELCRTLLNKGSWKSIAKIVKGLKEDPEKVRWAVLGYMNSVLLNSGQEQAALLIENFADPFYDSGKAGLTLACYESTL